MYTTWILIIVLSLDHAHHVEFTTSERCEIARKQLETKHSPRHDRDVKTFICVAK